MERRRLNPIAHQKLSTLNPGTIFAVNKISKPLITNVKSPNVKILIGNVKMISNGFKNALIRPITTAATSAATKLSTWTPGKRYAVIAIAKVKMSHDRIIAIKLVY